MPYTPIILKIHHMQKLSAWALPVAVSLLLHTLAIVLVNYQLSSSSTVIKQVQTINVGFLEQISPSEKKPQPKKNNPPVKPAPEPVPITPVKPEIKETSTETAPIVETRPTPETPASSQLSGLNVQPLSKLTRPPAFLHKIDPVYPVAEQRAGSQANVLAEVTIDDKGNVREVRIIKSAGENFDNAVREALLRSAFVPGYIDKQAVAVRVIVPFRFNLR